MARAGRSYAARPTLAGPSVVTGLGVWGPPTGVVATAVGANRVDLYWDSVPVATAYRVWRDGAVLAAYVGSTSYSDVSVQPGVTYSYEVASIR
jgi:hypothetical protein